MNIDEEEYESARAEMERTRLAVAPNPVAQREMGVLKGYCPRRTPEQKVKP